MEQKGSGLETCCLDFKEILRDNGQEAGRDPLEKVLELLQKVV